MTLEELKIYQHLVGNIKIQIQCNVTKRSYNTFVCFSLIFKTNSLIFHSEQWCLQCVIVENSYNCAKWCSAMTYQKVNSFILSKSAMNSFKEMFPLSRMFPLAVMHTNPSSPLKFPKRFVDVPLLHTFQW